MQTRRSWVLDVRICWTVLIVFCSLSLIPANGSAALVPSRLADGAGMTERTAQIETIRQALEKEVVAQRLADYGLSAEEITARLPSLSDEQLHQLSSLSKDIVAGDGLGVVIALLVIVILVIVIVKLMDKEIIIR
jgi:hypothetical protein